mgnify:FL=1
MFRVRFKGLSPREPQINLIFQILEISTDLEFYFEPQLSLGVRSPAKKSSLSVHVGLRSIAPQAPPGACAQFRSITVVYITNRFLSLFTVAVASGQRQSNRS